MSRTVAIALTLLTSIFCGLPGLGLICFGILGAIGAQTPDYKATHEASPETLWLGLFIFFCSGAILLLFPVIVGFFSFRLSALAGADSDDSQFMSPLP